MRLGLLTRKLDNCEMILNQKNMQLISLESTIDKFKEEARRSSTARFLSYVALQRGHPHLKKVGARPKSDVNQGSARSSWR